MPRLSVPGFVSRASSRFVSDSATRSAPSVHKPFYKGQSLWSSRTFRLPVWRASRYGASKGRETIRPIQANPNRLL